MSSTHSFKFDNMARLGSDLVTKNEEDMQNNVFGSYTTTNFFAHHCGMKKPIEFATNQPNVFYNGGVGNCCDVNGCNIDIDSKLRILSTQTNPKCRIGLQERTFRSVPYLGKGQHKPDVESKLLYSGYSMDKKNAKILTESCFNCQYMEMVPSLKHNIQKPENLIEESADSNWIRGGTASREVGRDRIFAK
jgi:hypothetical protein